MKHKSMMIVFSCLLIFGCSSISSESWVDYDDISKISLGMNQNIVVSNLGEPLLILSGSDSGDNIKYLYYNFHLKKYLPNKASDSVLGKRASKDERKILLKFTFEDDELLEWEEDKITLALATNKKRGGSTTFLQYFSLLLNLILIIKIL